MNIVFITIIAFLVIVLFFVLMNRAFHTTFQKLTLKIRDKAGTQQGSLLAETDLNYLPPPVHRYLLASGLVGRKKISFMRIWHAGTFKVSKEKDFMPVTGEYFLSTAKPSFSWLGKISPVPGISFTALDSYFNGKGNMIVKLMSTIKIVDAKSSIIDRSAFGRCVAEMTMAPSFFLDHERVKWTTYDSNHAECIVTDAGLSANAQLYFKADGSLEKFVVDRYYDRGNGQGTLEKFVIRSNGVKDFNGLKINTIYDGYWNLAEGDLHYVHFVLEKVEFE